MSALDFPLPSGRVLCAVSGGADSVCLLHSCLRLARGGDTTVCAAHYNHCLRGGESDRDERFVRSLCASLGVELRVGRGDVAAYARGRGMGTEEAARELRYAFLEEGRGRARLRIHPHGAQRRRQRGDDAHGPRPRLRAPGPCRDTAPARADTAAHARRDARRR